MARKKPLKISSPKLKPVPKYTAEQNELADELVDWVIENEVFELERFPCNKRMSPTKFFRIAENNDYFFDALDFARWIVAARLQEGWRTNKLSTPYIRSMLGLYHAGYQAQQQEKLRANVEAKESARLVIVDRLEADEQPSDHTIN